MMFPSSSSSSSSSSSGSSRRRTSLRAERSKQSASRLCRRILVMSTWYSVPVGKSSGRSLRVLARTGKCTNRAGKTYLASV
ncbi:MAG: hypothetical protein DMG78_21070 [Acidobacteria bacterium]|nr:MAG: hypothetical protein DMG78_21070 [Acidobacteriota bacterium]